MSTAYDDLSPFGQATALMKIAVFQAVMVGSPLFQLRKYQLTPDEWRSLRALDRDDDLPRLELTLKRTLALMEEMAP